LAKDNQAGQNKGKGKGEKKHLRGFQREIISIKDIVEDTNRKNKNQRLNNEKVVS
jgi:hypothetical protein